MFLAYNKKEVKMSNIKKNNELKKQFDDMIYEIVKVRTFDYSEEVDKLINIISPKIEKMNSILNKNTLNIKSN